MWSFWLAACDQTDPTDVAADVFSGGATATQVQISATLADRPVVTWVDGSGDALTVRRTSSGWTAPETLGAWVGGAYLPETPPQVGTDEAGCMTAAWTQSPVIVSRAGTLEGGWGAVTTVATAAAGPPQQPALAVQGDGTALLAWVDVDVTHGRAGTVRAARRVGGSWTPATLGNPTNLLGVAPRAALDGAGDGAVVWVQVANTCAGCTLTRDHLLAARWDGAWQTADAYDAGEGTVAYPDVAFGLPGRFRAVHTKEVAGVAVARGWTNDAGIWSGPDTMATDPAERTTVAGAPDGTWVMAWSSDDGTNLHPLAAVFPAGGAGPVEDLAADPGADTLNVAVAARSGTAAIAFADEHPTTGAARVVARRWVPAGWSDPVVLSSCTAPACFVDHAVDVAIDAAGTVWVAWIQQDAPTALATVRVASF